MGLLDPTDFERLGDFPDSVLEQHCIALTVLLLTSGSSGLRAEAGEASGGMIFSIYEVSCLI
jgi:hypothetical protein